MGGEHRADVEAPRSRPGARPDRARSPSGDLDEGQAGRAERRRRSLAVHLLGQVREVEVRGERAGQADGGRQVDRGETAAQPVAGVAGPTEPPSRRCGPPPRDRGSPCPRSGRACLTELVAEPADDVAQLVDRGIARSHRCSSGDRRALSATPTHADLDLSAPVHPTVRSSGGPESPGDEGGGDVRRGHHRRSDDRRRATEGRRGRRRGDHGGRGLEPTTRSTIRSC